MFSILGAVIGMLAGSQIENFINYITPLAAGGFIYIATADIMPELHKETKISKSLKQLAGILAGMGIMLILRIYLE
jgi:zinc transporter ZupT